MNNETKDINLDEEKEKIRDKIDKINKSGVYDKIKAVLKSFRKKLKLYNINNVRLEGRVKKEDSASNKIERQGVSADMIYDLIGFMLIVELPEEYEKVSTLMQELMPKGSFIHNFDGKMPENNGYSSFHMGVNVNQLLSENSIENTYGEDDGLQAEVQLKSYGMYMAQEATHDSIYKNPNLSNEQKNRMQSVMFPLIEKISDMEKYQERLEICFDEKERGNLQSRIETVKQEVLQHKMKNKQFIEDNMIDIENVLKEYVVVKYVENVRQDPVLNLTREKITEIAEQCNRAVNYLSNDFEQERMSNTEPTGFKNTDKLLEETQEKSINEINELAERNNKREVNGKKALEDCMGDDKSRISLEQEATRNVKMEVQATKTKDMSMEER